MMELEQIQENTKRALADNQVVSESKVRLPEGGTNAFVSFKVTFMMRIKDLGQLAKPENHCTLDEVLEEILDEIL